jgi:predicted ATPase with chaperone activity
MSLSREQRCALDRFIKGENLFITGPGGTGKTFLIKEWCADWLLEALPIKYVL